MKTNARVLFGIGLFFLLALFGYMGTSLAFPHDGVGLFNRALPIEPVGTTILALCVGMAWFPAFWMFKAAHNMGGTPPEDDPNANIEDADPDYGWYAPWSWWPLAVAVAAGVIFAGLAVGTWLTIIGAALLVIALVGFSFEAYRGRLAH
ncbi:aa3-type cytochrome oxidase subunit IV [Pseudoclavibacter caeni]|jgi:hypothetical protein|uniref:cytochrome-c oxidase n=1 Tax=Pseudoclavibacter caeni TaxID=908846 RepID=A0A7C8FJ52_9MICO|nr:cytochrome c oxidase subunit 4 [Pseudoclavibacter caeni]KAB1632966.1 cytochrome c oxidase subunit 4 [Pseudoclavibacter caeni]NYJ97062.1 O-antigen/teichoic acid export membrane protein [Pseudoclavibacter caeni]